MLPKKNRFPFRGNFPKKIVHTPLFTLRYEGGEEELKAGIVVSKKVSKKATERNRIRRLFSERLYERIGLPFSVVFFVKKDAVDSKREDLKKYIDSTLDSLLK